MGIEYVVVDNSNAMQPLSVPQCQYGSNAAPLFGCWLDVIRFFHEGLLSRCFEDCLEEFSIWERLLVHDIHSARYYLSIVVAYTTTTSEDERDGGSCGGCVMPVGVAVFERYKESQTLWLGYLAVEEQCRGRGIAKNLVNTISRVAPSLMPHCPVVQFILCAKRQHGGDDSVPASVRHRLYTALGFVPLDLEFFDCGRLREEHPSSLAVFRPTEGPLRDRIVSLPVSVSHSKGVDSDSADGLAFGYPAEPILHFIRDLYTGILSEEGKRITNEMDEYETAFGFSKRREEENNEKGIKQSIVLIPMGHPFWH